MQTVYSILLIVGCIFALYVLLKIIAAPIKLIFKILLNALVGFVLLFLANIVSSFFDFSIPINLISCLISGIFGIPGVIFLVMLKILF